MRGSILLNTLVVFNNLTIHIVYIKIIKKTIRIDYSVMNFKMI